MDVDNQAEKEIVHQFIEVEIKTEKTDESMSEDGPMLAHNDSETLRNVYNSYFDVQKYELCSTISEVEHLSDKKGESTSTISLNNTELTDSSDKKEATNRSRLVEKEIVHQFIEVEIKTEKTDESMSDDGPMLAHNDSETLHNVYDSYFDVHKHELCDSISEMEHLSDKQVESTSTITLNNTELTDNVEEKKVTNRSRRVKRGDNNKGKKLFTCEHCLYKTEYKSELVRHTRTHTGEKPYSCKHCEFKSSRKSNLKAHMRTHTGEKPYSCKLCDLKFSEASGLQRHKRTHTGEKPYSCMYCDFKTSHKHVLNDHLRIHNGNTFACEHCLFKTEYKNNLVGHMRIHTGEKPYSCRHCEFKSSHKGNLKAHMRTHTGEKPYSCKLCDLKFSQASGLQAHIRTHTGEKPYSCKYLL